jgi:hypothetical protein
MKITSPAARRIPIRPRNYELAAFASARGDENVRRFGLGAAASSNIHLERGCSSAG